MEMRLLLYYFAIAVGAALSAVCGWRLGKKAGLPKKPLKIFLSFAMIFGFLGALIMGQLQNFIMSLTLLTYNVSRMRIFGGLLFMPLMLYFPVRVLAGDFRLVSDIFSPGLYLLLGFSKIGCAMYGCCYGIPWEYGVPTPFENHLCFPVQALEALLCFAVFGVMYFLAASGRLKKGTAYPTGMIIYGTVRFFVEFLRYYPEEQRTYFLGVGFWQLMSVITVIIGALWLISLRHRNIQLTL